MKPPDDMTLIAHDGELELYATKDKRFGVVHDTVQDILSERQPLQVFFKWGNFEAVS